MSKIYNQENKKDKFITSDLFQYFMDNIEKKNVDIAQVEEMNIFPYKTSKGIEISNLKEDDIDWYFAQKDSDTVSSKAYRIVADNVLSQDQFKSFKNVFSNKIKEFSDKAVRENLLEKMSSETQYTENWWNYAYDVFQLWDENDKYSYSELAKATKNMDNNSFMFLSDYCSDEIKKELIKQKIFTDIKNSLSNKLFWNKTDVKNDNEKAIEMLKLMGVPHTFTYEGKINSNIEKLFILVKNKYNRFIKSREGETPLFDVAYSILWDFIFKEEKDLIISLVEDNMYKGGMLVKNIFQQYVPLSYDLFYSKDELKIEDEEDESEVDIIEKLYVDSLEKSRLDIMLYDEEMFSTIDTIHKFSEVDEEADEYNLVNDVDEIYFYKWVWNYSKHIELAENILTNYTGGSSVRSSIPQNDRDFILEVLYTDNLVDDEYSYVWAIATYLKNKYKNLIINVPEINWEKAYRGLAQNAYKFIIDKKEFEDDENIYGNLAPTNDITTFNKERAIWKTLEESYNELIKNKNGLSLLKKDSKQFLFSKYMGRCQLCGDRTVKNEQDAHSFTYRITK